MCQPRITIQEAQCIKQLQAAQHGLGGRGSGEVEAHQVVDAQRLELQHHRGEVAALELRDGVRSQGLAEEGLRVQPAGNAEKHR